MSEVCGLLSAILTVLLYLLSAVAYLGGLLFARTVFSWTLRG